MDSSASVQDILLGLHYFSFYWIDPRADKQQIELNMTCLFECAYLLILSQVWKKSNYMQAVQFVWYLDYN